MEGHPEVTTEILFVLEGPVTARVVHFGFQLDEVTLLRLGGEVSPPGPPFDPFKAPFKFRPLKAHHQALLFCEERPASLSSPCSNL